MIFRNLRTRGTPLMQRLGSTVLVAWVLVFSPAVTTAADIAQLRTQAEQGEAEAQFSLGLMYHTGEGVAQDYQAAVEWYRKAAAQDVGGAVYNLGLMYMNGQGVAQDYQEAREWFHKIADQAVAQYSLGVMSAQGQGGPQDYPAARIWFRKAADQGLATAQYSLGVLSREGQGGLRNYRDARTWFGKAADQGHVTAQFNLGVMCALGQGGPQDYEQARTWYRTAADQGSAAAQNNLGVMYQQGQGVPQDFVQAYKWLSIAGQGSPEYAQASASVTTQMTLAQIVEAQRLVQAWKRLSQATSLAAESQPSDNPTPTCLTRFTAAMVALYRAQGYSVDDEIQAVTSLLMGTSSDTTWYLRVLGLTPAEAVVDKAVEVQNWEKLIGKSFQQADQADFLPLFQYYNSRLKSAAAARQCDR